jgi:hypothetical protein
VVILILRTSAQKTVARFSFVLGHSSRNETPSPTVIPGVFGAHRQKLLEYQLGEADRSAANLAKRAAKEPENLGAGHWRLQQVRVARNGLTDPWFGPLL